MRNGVTQPYALMHAHTSNPTRGLIVLMAGGGGNLTLDSQVTASIVNFLEGGR